jgi:hypothetical protein
LNRLGMGKPSGETVESGHPAIIEEVGKVV